MMVKRSMGFSCHQMNKKAGEQMDTMAKINQFRDERNWRPHHNEKDLALSICLEAAELLELFQWKTAEEEKPTGTDRWNFIYGSSSCTDRHVCAYVI